MDILSIKMQKNDAGAETIKDYLIALLGELWAGGAEFSGKRPFGGSDWEYDLYKALISAGAIQYTLDEYGELCQEGKREADTLIFKAIKSL